MNANSSFIPTEGENYELTNAPLINSNYGMSFPITDIHDKNGKTYCKIDTKKLKTVTRLLIQNKPQVVI